jgi:hypothetical protein
VLTGISALLQTSEAKFDDKAGRVRKADRILMFEGAA